MTYAGIDRLDPRAGWLPVRLPDGNYMHVEVDRQGGTVDLVVRTTSEPTSDDLTAIRGLSAGYLVADVAPFVRGCFEGDRP